MSLQTYDFTIGLNKTQPIDSQGRYFYYLKGSTPNIDAGTVLATAGNQAIKITANGTGASVILMPGQSYRLPADDKSPSGWKVENYRNLEAITGQVFVGEGQFEDNNTLNTIKLDATFANQVKVMNSAAERVPVTLDTTQTLNIASNVVAYTNAYSSVAASPANTAIQMLAAVVNVNGALLSKFDIITIAGSAGQFAVIAKATAPASIADGDVLMAGAISATGNTQISLDLSKNGQIKVSPGKAIWYIANIADGAVLRNALFTVL